MPKPVENVYLRDLCVLCVLCDFFKLSCSAAKAAFERLANGIWCARQVFLALVFEEDLHPSSHPKETNGN
jgi:hypothetical protein